MSDARTQSFRDDKGNRFIFPSLIIYPGDKNAPSGSDVILKAMTLNQALRVKLEKDWFKFDPEHFPHIKTDAGHPGFFHGSATVYLFAGPVFDAACDEAATDKTPHPTPHPTEGAI